MAESQELHKALVSTWQVFIKASWSWKTRKPGLKWEQVEAARTESWRQIWTLWVFMGGKWSWLPRFQGRSNTDEISTDNIRLSSCLRLLTDWLTDARTLFEAVDIYCHFSLLFVSKSSDNPHIIHRPPKPQLKRHNSQLPVYVSSFRLHSIKSSRPSLKAGWFTARPHVDKNLYRQQCEWNINHERPLQPRVSNHVKSIFSCINLAHEFPRWSEFV